MWKVIIVSLAIIAIVAYIVYYRLQKEKEEREPEYREMMKLLGAIERYLEKTDWKDMKEGRRGTSRELPDNVVHALHHAVKILVLCQDKKGGVDFSRMDPAIGEGACVVMMILKNSVYFKLFASGKPEYGTRLGKRLGRLLGIPVEMV